MLRDFMYNLGVGETFQSLLSPECVKKKKHQIWQHKKISISVAKDPINKVNRESVDLKRCLEFI